MKVLVVQNNAVIADKKASFDKVLKLIEPFSDKKPDLIVLPEVFAVGWLCNVFPREAEEETNSLTLKFLSSLAKNMNANVVGGSYIRKTSDGKLKNTCPVFDRAGNLIAQYNKMHLFSHYEALENKFVTSGKTGVLVNTDVGKIGLSICYDIRFPELYRAYANAGADILVNVAAWPKLRPHHWEVLTKARAVENQIFMIACSQTGKIAGDEYNLGHSAIISSFGDVISSVSEEECAFLSEIDLESMQTLRKNVPTLFDKHSEYRVLEV